MDFSALALIAFIGLEGSLAGLRGDPAAALFELDGPDFTIAKLPCKLSKSAIQSIAVPSIMDIRIFIMDMFAALRGGLCAQTS
jgi:hypothetical protein